MFRQAIQAVICAVKKGGFGVNNFYVVLGSENKGDEKNDQEDGGFHGLIVLNRKL